RLLPRARLRKRLYLFPCIVFPRSWCFLLWFFLIAFQFRHGIPARFRLSLIPEDCGNSYNDLSASHSGHRGSCKNKEVPKAAAISAERTLQITKDRQTSNDKLHPRIGTYQ